MSAPNSIYNQYHTAYAHTSKTYGPNTAVLMLVGGFYELYDVIDHSGEPKTSMKRAVEVLGIQLKIKEKDAAGLDGLFAGFPKDSLMKYVALLTRENWTVAVYGWMPESRRIGPWPASIRQGLLKAPTSISALSGSLKQGPSRPPSWI